MQDKEIEKLYTIGEMSDILEIKEHTIRFWERKFPFLSPIKSSTGRRKYTSQDLLLLQQIKNLLYQQGFTLKGALKEIQNPNKHNNINSLNIVIEEDGLFVDENWEKKKNSVELTNKISNKPLFKQKNQKGIDKIEKKINNEILLGIYKKVNDLIDLWENL